MQWESNSEGELRGIEWERRWAVFIRRRLEIIVAGSCKRGNEPSDFIKML
jgi:hypothetical protein